MTPHPIQTLIRKLTSESETTGYLLRSTCRQRLLATGADPTGLEDLEAMLEDLGIWMVDSAPTPEAVRAHRDEAQREREATRIRREGETETPESRLLAARVPLAEPELVLRIAAEGGGLTLIRQRIDGGWRFRRTTSDQSLWTTGEAPSPLTRTSPWVATWDAAVQLLDRYPWVSLAPLVVHREYRAAVLQAVRERLSAPRRSISERAMQQWESACAPEADGTFSPGA